MTTPEILLPLFLVAVTSYLIGSVSFSIIFTRLFTGQDVREHGSGNAGTTNVLRTAGHLPAILTFAGDFLKCVVVVLFAQFIFDIFGGATFDLMPIRLFSGIFCMLGHIYPIFFGFRGGKAVASTAALMLMVDWRIFVVAFLVFAVVFAISRIVSLSSIISVLSVPVVTYILAYIGRKEFGWLDVLLSVVVAVILVYAHRSNIQRLRNGTEPKIGVKK